MYNFTKEYQVLYDNLKPSVNEGAVSAVLERLSQQYLKVLMKGLYEQETDEVTEATKQMAYVSAIMKKKLNDQSDICQMFFLAGINVGQSRVGNAWLQEQGNAKSFERNMGILCAKAHVKEIVKCIYENPGIQHGILAKMVGIRTNYLSQLTIGLEEAKCLRRFGTKKCTFYELTLSGKEFARKNFSEERYYPVRNDFLNRGREEESDRGKKDRMDSWKQPLLEEEQYRHGEAAYGRGKAEITDIGQFVRKKYEKPTQKDINRFQRYDIAK